MLVGAGLFSPNIKAGEFLEGVLQLVADREDAASALRSVNWRVDLERDPKWPRMVVSYVETDLPDDAQYDPKRFVLRPRDTPVGISRKHDPAWNFAAPYMPPSAVMLQTTTLLVPFFEVLAELWKDSVYQHGTIVSVQHVISAAASASTAPEKENPAALPGAAGSRLNQPPTKREQSGRQTPRKVGERGAPAKQRRAVVALTEE
jgi:hypothetical protein